MLTLYRLYFLDEYKETGICCMKCFRWCHHSCDAVSEENKKTCNFCTLLRTHLSQFIQGRSELRLPWFSFVLHYSTLFWRMHVRCICTLWHQSLFWCKFSVHNPYMDAALTLGIACTHVHTVENKNNSAYIEHRPRPVRGLPYFNVPIMIRSSPNANEALGFICVYSIVHTSERIHPQLS